MARIRPRDPHAFGKRGVLSIGVDARGLTWQPLCSADLVIHFMICSDSTFSSSANQEALFFRVFSGGEESEKILLLFSEQAL